MQGLISSVGNIDSGGGVTPSSLPDIETLSVSIITNEGYNFNVSSKTGNYKLKMRVKLRDGSSYMSHSDFYEKIKTGFFVLDYLKDGDTTANQLFVTNYSLEPSTITDVFDFVVQGRNGTRWTTLDTNNNEIYPPVSRDWKQSGNNVYFSFLNGTYLGGLHYFNIGRSFNPSGSYRNAPRFILKNRRDSGSTEVNGVYNSNVPFSCICMTPPVRRSQANSTGFVYCTGTTVLSADDIFTAETCWIDSNNVCHVTGNNLQLSTGTRTLVELTLDSYEFWLS